MWERPECRDIGTIRSCRLLLALRLYFPIKRRHANAQHARRLFAGTTALIERRLDVAALLLLDEFIERLTHRHRRYGLLGFLALRRSHDLRRKIARQNQIFLAQGATALDRVLQLAHVARVIV